MTEIKMGEKKGADDDMLGHGRGVDPPCQIGLFAKLSILTAAS